MRIVGGEHRGRKLFAPEGEATRPTSEKVREALFDILGARVAGAAFGDLYAGTGAVGLEALSRGATRCLFVERRRRALECLRRNIEALRAGPRARILPVDAAQAMALLEKEGPPLDILFCDPPYADGRWPSLLAAMGASGILAAGCLLVVEHAAKALPACPEGMKLRRSYRYGDTGLTVFERTDEERRGCGNGEMRR